MYGETFYGHHTAQHQLHIFKTVIWGGKLYQFMVGISLYGTNNGPVKHN